MKRFVEGLDRGQSTLFPASLDDHVTEDNPTGAVDVFVDGLNLDKLGFVGVQPLDTGRPSYHPRVMLKLYIYGYLNRVPSSRRLERECQRNIELIWLTGQLAPDFKTIADFRKDNGKAVREVCGEFVALCRKLDLLSAVSVAIDGSKFKAVNARDKNLTEAKMKRRLERIDESIARYLSQLETADSGMMGRQDRDQWQLFYEFNLEEVIPKEHLLRRMNVFVTGVLADVHQQLRPTDGSASSISIAMSSALDGVFSASNRVIRSASWRCRVGNNKCRPEAWIVDAARNSELAGRKLASHCQRRRREGSFSWVFSRFRCGARLPDGRCGAPIEP
jgi:transposase